MGEDFSPNCKVVEDDSVEGATVLICKPRHTIKDITFQCPRDMKVLMKGGSTPKIVDDGGCREETIKKTVGHLSNYKGR